MYNLPEQLPNSQPTNPTTIHLSMAKRKAKEIEEGTAAEEPRRSSRRKLNVENKALEKESIGEAPIKAATKIAKGKKGKKTPKSSEASSEQTNRKEEVDKMVSFDSYKDSVYPITCSGRYQVTRLSCNTLVSVSDRLFQWSTLK